MANVGIKSLQMQTADGKWQEVAGTGEVEIEDTTPNIEALDLSKPVEGTIEITKENRDALSMIAFGCTYNQYVARRLIAEDLHLAFRYS